MVPIQLSINAHQSVKCCLYHAPRSNKIILIVAAVGVLQSFYSKIAAFFQKNNLSAITFDYTGIGDSLQGNIRKENSSLSDWGNRDLDAVINYTTGILPGHKLILLGHSIGGPLIGLAASSGKADKMILVAAQSGYWKFWTGVSQWRMWVNWFLLVPALTGACGYLPARRFSKMENLPKNVAAEWAKWCRNRDYLFSNHSQHQLHFDRVRCPLTSISFDDDRFAPEDSVDWLTDRFEHARVKRLHLFPEQFNASVIGHFAGFSEKFKDNFWSLLLEEANN